MAAAPATAGSMLDITEASVRFGDRPALDRLDLDVAAGEVVGVLGPSGSGKTTLLRAIAGLQALDAGAIRIDGADQTHVPAHRRGVGLMFQDHALFPHRDVAANVAFGLRMQGWARDAMDARVHELLELVGLADAAHRSVTTLSGGEQQRVALARALAPRPRVLLLDEPLGSLDRWLRERLARELRALFVELGQTVVAVTHDHDEAFTLADRLALLDAGRVVQTGSPRELWARPVSARAATILGLPNLTTRDGRDVLIRPDAIRLDPAGELDGVVVERTFSTVGMRLVVRHAGGELEFVVDTALAPDVAAPVRVSIDPSGVTELGSAS